MRRGTAGDWTLFPRPPLHLVPTAAERAVTSAEGLSRRHRRSGLCSQARWHSHGYSHKSGFGQQCKSPEGLSFKEPPGGLRLGPEPFRTPRHRPGSEALLGAIGAGVGISRRFGRSAGGAVLPASWRQVRGLVAGRRPAAIRAITAGIWSRAGRRDRRGFSRKDAADNRRARGRDRVWPCAWLRRRRGAWRGKYATTVRLRQFGYMAVIRLSRRSTESFAPLRFFLSVFKGLKGGWGTWIRTRTNGVRVRGSTVNLFPNTFVFSAP